MSWGTVAGDKFRLAGREADNQDFFSQDIELKFFFSKYMGF